MIASMAALETALLGADAFRLGALVSDPIEHRGLRPLGEPEPAVRGVDARVLLVDDDGRPMARR